MMNTEKTTEQTWPRLALVAVLCVFILSCKSVYIVTLFQTPTPTLTSTPTPTLTPTPTSTPTPTPTPTTGSLLGEIIEAPVDSSDAQRPLLTDALIVLCLRISTNQCVVDEKLSTRSDNEQKFALEIVPPGEYIVLYNPFPIKDVSAYWKHWDRRELIFTDADALFKSMTSDGTVIIGAEEGGGVSASFVGGQMQLGAVLGNTAIWLEAFPLVVEFVDKQEPLSIEIVAGQATEVIIRAHASISK
jgi:hypothetical protein